MAGRALNGRQARQHVDLRHHPHKRSHGGRAVERLQLGESLFPFYRRVTQAEIPKTARCQRAMVQDVHIHMARVVADFLHQRQDGFLVALKLLAKPHAVKHQQACNVFGCIGDARFCGNVSHNANGRIRRNGADVKHFMELL